MNTLPITRLEIIGLCFIYLLLLSLVPMLVIGSIVHESSERSFKTEESRDFWAYDFFEKEYYQVPSRLLAIGDYCYIYMEETCISLLGEESVVQKALSICNEFDQTIYPRIIDLAGHPNGTMGDIDNDFRIFILFFDGYNYYSEANDIEHNISNHCEMFYINYGLLYHYWLYPTMAHEFHHLIWFNNDWGEPPFTLEALAQYATYHAGYLDPYNNLTPQVASYLPHPDNSPLYWNNDEDYGSTYLFAFYIAEKYGVQILKDLINEPSDGPHGIESVLRSAGNNITFNELFLNWGTALTIDELGFQNNLFGFEGCDPKIRCNEDLDEIPFINQSISLGHYAFYIYKIVSPPDNFTVTINKSPQHMIGVSVAYHDSFGWHVNQSLHYEEISKLNDSISGYSINEAYVITSYISNGTPIAPEERVEGGPFIDIEISITEGIHDSKKELPPIHDSDETTPETVTATTSTTSEVTSSSFPSVFIILLFFTTLVIFLCKHKKT